MKLNFKLPEALLFGLAFAMVSCSSDDDANNQSPSILALNTTLIDTSLLFDSVEVLEDDGVTTTFTAADVLNIEVIAHTTSELAFEAVILGEPTPTGDDATIPPASGDRALAVEDFVVNSAISNPSSTDGMTFQFVNSAGVRTPITNGPGPDILMLEVGSPEGAPAPPMNTNIAVPGDPFVLRGVGADAGNSATFEPDDYQRIGSDGFASGMSFFIQTQTTPGTPEPPLTSLAELEAASLMHVIETDLNLYGVLIDLDDLGFASGASVNQLTILSTGTMFAVDPALIVGFVR